MRGLSPSACAHGATCHLRRRAPSQRRLSCSARAPALAVSGQKAHHSSSLCARVMQRWLWPVRAVNRGSALARCPSPSARAHGATCQLRHPMPCPRRLSRGDRAHAHCLWGGGAPPDFAACAPCRADCGRLMPHRRVMRRQEALLPWRALVVRRASCGVECQASTVCHAAHACRRSLSLGRMRTARANCAPAPCRDGRGRPISYKGDCADERPISFDVRLWCNVPAAASSTKPAPLVMQRTPAARRRSLSQGRRRTTRVRCTRAPCSAGCGRLMPYSKAVRRRDAPLLRRASVVQRASCGLKCQACAACHAAHSCQRSLSLGRRRTTRVCCARAPYRASCGQPKPHGRTLRQREAPLLRRAPMVRRASCGVQCQARAACSAAHARRRSLSLGRRRANRGCCAHAPCCADGGRLIPFEKTLRS